MALTVEEACADADVVVCCASVGSLIEMGRQALEAAPSDCVVTDVGSTKPIYKKAEFVTFCSAKLSRAMMEANPANIGYCPYVVFVYETVAKPGVVIGYRVPTKAKASPATKAALAEIDKMLAGIIKEAAK